MTFEESYQGIVHTKRVISNFILKITRMKAQGGAAKVAIHESL
jgi:hypothetical protein